MRREGLGSLVAGIVLLMLIGCGGGERAGQTEQQAMAAAREEAKQPPPTDPDAPATRPSGFGKEAYRLVEQPDEIVSVLKNGATVICKRVPSPVVSVRGYIYTGGVYEGQWLGGGLSHLLEHLVAGGSSKRRTEAQNRDLLQRIGNNSNAYTTSDHTAYFINTTPDHLAKAVDLVTGWMLGALITPQEYRREYEVVQRELEKDKGEPDWVFWQLTQQNRYLVSPARVPVIGFQEVIRGLSRDDVYEYYKLTYQPNNMLFAVTGDLEPREMLAAVQKHLDDAPPGRVFERDIPDEPPVVAPRTSVATFPKLGQARLEIGFPSIKLQHPDLYALDLLATILGSGESSILVEELRDKRRLVNAVSVASFTPQYVEGTFAIDMQLDPAKIPDATKALLEILEQVIRQPIPADRIQSAKVQMRAQRVKSQQTSEDIGSSLARDFISTGDPHFSDRYVTRIEAVTADQLQMAARSYLNRQRMITTALIPAEFAGSEGLPKAEDLLRQVAPTTQQIATATQSKVNRIVLGDGTILLHKQISTSSLVVMQMYALGGLTAEDTRTNGIGNLTMQMLPRGTMSQNAMQIATFWDSIGGDLATSCGNNSWVWNAQCLRGDFDKAFGAYTDVIKNPIFPPDELAQLKKRVLAQIEDIESDWHTESMRFFRKAYFGPQNSPYQFLSIGSALIVQAATSEQCRQWYQDKVLKSRRVLAIYGDVSLEAAQAAASKAFTPAQSKVTATTQPPTAEPLPAVSRVEQPTISVDRIETNKAELPVAGVIIGFDSDSFVGDPANFPLDLADTMTSGWGYPTGYLHEILRGRGLVYVVHGQNMLGRGRQIPGTFFVYAGCDPDKVNEVVDVILENVARLQGPAQTMQPGWFERAKQLITTSEAMDRETPAEQATSASLDELFGLGYDYRDKFAERINAVTLDQVRGIASKRLIKCVVTVTTPAPDLVKLKTGTRTYKDFPPVDLTPRGVQHDAK